MRFPKLVLVAILFVASIAGCGKNPSFKKMSASDYQDKVYASWLGQIIGNIYGLPHENAHIEQPGPENFPYGYGPNIKRLQQFNGAFSDDDTDIEYMYLLSMEKYGPEPTYAQLAEAWKYHVRDRVWLANRAALGAMHFGYTPPITGMKTFNPHWFQIDPQLVNEIWAVTAPGMVNYAADKSGWAARITDDDWGIEPTIFYGAMYAAAFFESDIHNLINIGLKSLPQGSRFAGTVQDVESLYKKYPDDWKKARQEMAKNYYDEEPLATKTIWNANLNGACAILALLYGQGDFQHTIDLCSAMGFDADNQTATMAGLLGVIKGTKGLPHDLLYPIKGWQKPFNDFYKNITRFDMPDASLHDMAARMAHQGEKIILKYGGKKVNENGNTYYLINTDVAFTAPLEFPAAPLPYIEVNKIMKYEFYVSGGKPPYKWSVISGQFPDGLKFQNGKLEGMATTPGIYPVQLQIEQNDKKISREFRLIVRGKNLAPSATEIIANVKKTVTKIRDAMWLTVAKSLYADSVNLIHDGRRYGDGSTFYSINDSQKPKIDYYGYKWEEAQTIGLLGFHTGAMEENGGWFTSLNVQYQDANGNWKPVSDLIVSPPLVPGTQPHNKPHFVEYMLAFKPIRTKAIRMLGDAGGVKHWYSKPAYFTSISELSVHGPLPGYEELK